jgi:ferredoxin-NADP reductase
MPVHLRLVRRDPEADHTVSFYFQPETPFDFVAGQYLLFSLPHADPDQRGTERAFTIASAPSEPLLRLTTRLSAEPSSFKYALSGLARGAVLDASGPHGQFVFQRTEPSVFIAGGIGITPFRAMLGDLARSRPRITLLYSNSTPDIPFRTFLDGRAQQWPELKAVYTVTRASLAWHGLTERIDARFIEQHAWPTNAADYYVCGPTVFVESVRGALLELAVDVDHIHSEGFPGYERAPRPEPAAVRSRS